MSDRRICDYEGSDYRTRFWGGRSRDYEDQVERIALRRLMPPFGSTLLDVGAGFGRLADEYDGYGRVVLLDYSRSLLREAQERLGGDPRFLFVAADWYQMPFVDGLFDTLIQVRTIHHASDAPALLRQLARITRPGGHYILEFANKQNLKAIARYWLKRQDWSPFERSPVEFVTLNFDFHPTWMRQQLQATGFAPTQTLSVSHFRLPFLKRLIPTGILTRLDRYLQPTGRWWRLTPSLFIHSRKEIAGPVASSDQVFACPHCQTTLKTNSDFNLLCPSPNCNRHWLADGRFFDFKEPLS